MAHKLRMALSVFCMVLTVALCVMWVRSYHRVRYLQCDVGQMHSAGIHSYRGTATFYAMHNNIAWCSRIRSAVVDRRRVDAWVTRSNFRQGTICREWWLSVPFWFLATTIVTVALATFPSRVRITWRFSLRTLIVATTLLAVVLGIMAWTVR